MFTIYWLTSMGWRKVHTHKNWATAHAAILRYKRKYPQREYTIR